jgi:tetratricopeptide (TPR) repeat protein
MECRIIDLQDYAYGFLDGEEASRVRDHVAACARCSAVLARLDAEKRILAEAAAPRARRGVPTAALPLVFAASLLLGLLWLLMSRPAPPPETAAVPAAQDKGKGPADQPGDEPALRSQIVKLEAALKEAAGDPERTRIQASLDNLRIRLQRLQADGDKTAMKEKTDAPKKPVVKTPPSPNDERLMMIKMEMKDLSEKIKSTADPDEKAKLEKRVQELTRETKQLQPPAKTPVNAKEVELKLQANPDDVGALVDRATWHLDNGRAEPAMKDLDRAITLKPDLAPAYLKRAVAHAMLGHQPQAWQDAKRGEELDLKAGKAIDDTYRTIKKLMGSKERKVTAGDVEQQIASLRDRLEELRAMSGNADLAPAERERAARDADRVQAEIERLGIELKSRPAEPEKKVDKKK